MNESTSPVPLSPREHRVLLWLCSAAICWRWIAAMRTPLPGVDACADLWVAAQLAHGSGAALAWHWWQPLWSLLLAPLVVCGVTPAFAAQILATLLGGMVLWPVAAAAQRLREGAGLPAAVLAMVAAGPVLAAGAGAATSLHALLIATAAWFAVGVRFVPAVLLAATVAAAGTEVVRGDAGGLLSQLAVAGGPALLALPLAMRSPRPVRARCLWIVLGIVAGIALATRSWATLLPTWSPLLAVLGGVGLVRVSARWRELLLCVIVGVDCFAAWQQVEGARASDERWLGRYLARHYAASGDLVSDLPRVIWAYGGQPQYFTADDLLAAARRDGTALIVLGPGGRDRATLTATLAASFTRCQLSPDLVDAADNLGALVLVRRP